MFIASLLFVLCQIELCVHNYSFDKKTAQNCLLNLLRLGLVLDIKKRHTYAGHEY